MPFYLRFHAGPIGYSARLTGNRRQPSQQQGSGCLGILVFAAIIGALALIFRFWYISLPIIGGLLLVLLLMSMLARVGISPSVGDGDAPPVGPPRYTVVATKPGESPFEETGIPGPRAEQLVKELKKKGWRTDVLVARPEQDERAPIAPTPTAHDLDQGPGHRIKPSVATTSPGDPDLATHLEFGAPPRSGYAALIMVSPAVGPQQYPGDLRLTDRLVGHHYADSESILDLVASSWSEAGHHPAVRRALSGPGMRDPSRRPRQHLLTRGLTSLSPELGTKRKP